MCAVSLVPCFFQTWDLGSKARMGFVAGLEFGSISRGYGSDSICGQRPRQRGRTTVTVTSFPSAPSEEEKAKFTAAAAERHELSRRDVLAGLMGSLVGMGWTRETALAEPVSGQSVVNGVLSGYGLPSIPDKSGFVPVLAEYGRDAIVEFLYPNAWILVKEQGGIDRPRLDPQRVPPTITAGDYRKAEGIAFYATSASGKSTFDVPKEVIAKIAITLPNPDVVYLKDTKLDSSGYRFTVYKFETNTTSGYNAERRALAVSTVIDDTLFVLGAACNELRFKKIEPLIMTSFENFKVTKVTKKKT